jgi:hypothetical protein
MADVVPVCREYRCFSGSGTRATLNTTNGLPVVLFDILQHPAALTAH